MTEAVDVLGLGNSLVDLIAHADDAYLIAQDMVKGAMTLIDEDRAEALYAARVNPRIVSGGSASQHHRRRRLVRRQQRLYRQGQERRARLRLHGGHARHRRRLRHPPGRGGAGDRPLFRLRDARRRAHDEHLPGREHLSVAARRRRGLGARLAHRLPRGLHVGPAGGQVGVPEGGGDRARRRAIASP